MEGSALTAEQFVIAYRAGQDTIRFSMYVDRNHWFYSFLGQLCKLKLQPNFATSEAISGISVDSYQLFAKMAVPRHPNVYKDSELQKEKLEFYQWIFPRTSLKNLTFPNVDYGKLLKIEVMKVVFGEGSPEEQWKEGMVAKKKNSILFE